jgi:hypothetical protein
MKWLFRAASLIYLSVALAACALALVLLPAPGESKALPKPVADGDQEIVWLYAATNAAPWERFVTAVQATVQRTSAGPEGIPLQVNDEKAFPSQTTAVPEIALSARGKKGRLWFRWYKTTSELKTETWVKSLLKRKPAPLAIIGGSSSDLAIHLADALKNETESTHVQTLLLLTTATADEATESSLNPGEARRERLLTSIYPGRTFRFCFTNRQIAEAVTDFIWSRMDTVPSSEPVYLTWWMDDPYSADLNKRFCETLAARPIAQSVLPISESILYSIGTFDRPNVWETESATRLMKAKLENYPGQERPLLVLPASALPARRFLRGLVRTAPVESRKFIVAMGDGINFNNVYRDRNVAWHIQDLPFPLVFFAHRNPVSRMAGFPLEAAQRSPDATETGSLPAGTDDLLLFEDVVETLAAAAYSAEALVADPDTLAGRLRTARWSGGGKPVGLGTDGVSLFDADGNRKSGTGEHVVRLSPRIAGKQILPAADIEVLRRQAPRVWSLKASLQVHYDGYDAETAE